MVKFIVKKAVFQILLDEFKLSLYIEMYNTLKGIN